MSSVRAFLKKNVALWLVMLCGVLLDLSLMGLSLLWYPSVLEAGRASTVLACGIILLVYAGIGVGLPMKASPAVTIALKVGTILGLIIGAIFVLDLIVEDFIDLGPEASALSTLGFMALIFLCFGIAGASGMRKTSRFSLGILASLWSALLGVLIVLLFGFLMSFLFPQRLEHLLVSDYLSSGMRDPQAFTFFNAFDSASSHLLEAPIFAGICGTLGTFITQGRSALQRRGFRLFQPRTFEDDL